MLIPVPALPPLTYIKIVYKIQVCEVTQSCSALCDPVDCSPPGSSVHGIF